MSNSRWIVAATFAAFVCSAPSTLAQTQTPAAAPPAPYPAVFGGAAAEGEGRTGLGVSASLVEGYDNNLAAERTGAVPIAQLPPTAFQGSGAYTTFDPELYFKTHGKNLEFAANAGSTVRYFSDIHGFEGISENGAAGLTAHFGATTLFANQAVTYAPAYLYGLFASVTTEAPGDVVPAAPDYSLDPERAFTSATLVSATERIGRKASLYASGDLTTSSFTGSAPGFVNLRSSGVGGGFRYEVGRSTSLRIGYAHRRSQYSQALWNEDDLDVGIDATRPLSRSRKTTLTFSLGSTFVKAPLQSQDTTTVRRQFGALADVLVAHQMGRSWHLRGAYERGLRYIPGLALPVFSNGYSATLDGFINRRLDLQGGAAYSSGDLILLATTGSAFSTSTANLRLRYALARQWAVFGEGFYYFYNFLQGVDLPPGYAPRLTRSGVRVGLTFWAPLRRN